MNGKGEAKPAGEPAVWIGFDWPLDRYEDLVRRVIPCYEEQPEMIAEAIREACPWGAVRILELGAGTGSLARFLLDRFPAAQLTAVDVSPAMLAECRRILAAYGDRARVVEADLASADLGSGYDAIASRLAIHHLDDSRKAELFRRAFAALVPGGLLVNSDMVTGETEAERAALLDEWREYMRGRGDDPAAWEQWLAGDDDFPVTERAQTTWLEAAGFAGVRVVWRMAGFAVVQAVKPGSG
jgi:tRNA (cmo5U34)-methyltransferase